MENLRHLWKKEEQLRDKEQLVQEEKLVILKDMKRSGEGTAATDLCIFTQIPSNICSSFLNFIQGGADSSSCKFFVAMNKSSLQVAVWVMLF